MKLLSIDYIPGTEIEALGMVKGTVVQTKNVGRDFMAGNENTCRWRNRRLYGNVK